MLNEEGVQKSDKILLSLSIVRLLNVNEELNATAFLFKDAVDQEQCIGYEIIITVHSLYYLKEQSNVIFSFPFLKVKVVRG
jgi:hypothetical protein